MHDRATAVERAAGRQPRIADYAIIGNGRSAALVSREGSIDWLCWPRFDSASVFAALLDPKVGGRWRIAPTGRARVTRRYVRASNVLCTNFELPGGALRVLDLMPVLDEADKKKLLLPEHEILRVVECVRGEVQVESTFDPRLDYGAREVRMHSRGALGVRIEDGPRIYTLRADVPLEADGQTTLVTRFRLREGERRFFSLAYDEGGPAILNPLGEHADAAVRRTIEWWQRWADRCTYAGPYREPVLRSLLVLKLLGHAPSGAIVAAPTTSLPERIGGDLNWDYRYCWLRDASFTVHELLDLGYTDEATAFVDWLLHCTRLTRPRLNVLYDVYGRAPAPERVLSHLDGFAGSRPVRIGNAALDQLQLDTHGEVIDAVTHVCHHGAFLDRETRKMLRQFARFVCENWSRPDHGIWEPRIEPQHHTHSRVLCWTALDRVLELHRIGVLDDVPAARIRATRDAIRDDVEAHSWNPELRSYTQVQGGRVVDASLLLLGWYGFVRPSCERMQTTYAKICERLSPAPGLLYRYEQSRMAGEGAFGICSFWAAEFLARGGGRLADAEAWFEAVLGYANDVGILAEEIDPATGEALGNTPQAFTHVGLVSAALAIEERRRAELEPGARPPRAPGTHTWPEVQL